MVDEEIKIKDYTEFANSSLESKTGLLGSIENFESYAEDDSIEEPDKLSESELVSLLQKLPPEMFKSGSLTSVGGSLQSGNFKPGVAGWKIGSAGIFELVSIFFNKQTVITFFESFDGWVGSGGTRTPLLGGANLQTGAVSGTVVRLNNEITGGVNEVVFSSKNPVFDAYVAFSATTLQTIYFGVGDLNIGDGTQEGFGFKIVNNTLSALSTYSDGVSASETLTTISGITITNMNNYRAIMDSGKSRIQYFVNGALVATHSANIPDTDSPTLISFSIKNDEAANKIMYLKSAVFVQEL